MGYWENTVDLRTRDVSAVADAMIEIFAEEDYRLVDAPPRRTPSESDSMRYGTSADNSLWAVAIIPLLTPWLVIKTAPFELMIERPRPDVPMRIAQICRLLAVDGFQYNVYDTAQIMLVEADAEGRVRVSGGRETEDGEWAQTCNGEPIAHGRESFELITVEPELAAAMAAINHEATVGPVLCGTNDAYDNLIQVEYLIPHVPLRQRNSRVLYFRHPPPTFPRLASQTFK